MLNKHNNSYWYELLAQSTLQVVFPEEFKALKSSDKPDLIDTSLKMGIEVIHPVDERHMQIDSFYQKFLSGKTIAEVSEKGLSPLPFVTMRRWIHSRFSKPPISKATSICFPSIQRRSRMPF